MREAAVIASGGTLGARRGLAMVVEVKGYKGLLEKRSTYSREVRFLWGSRIFGLLVS